MSKLIGTGPNQVPSNADLGTLAYADRDNAGELTLNYLTTKSNNGTPTKIEISPSGADARILATNGDGGVGKIHWDQGGGGRWEFRSGGVDANTGLSTGSTTRLDIYYDGQIVVRDGAEIRYGGYDGTLAINTSGIFQDTQTRHSVRPTLNLDFANSKEIDHRIEYSRTYMNNAVQGYEERGPATYYDEKGKLRYSFNEEPRIDHDPETGECLGVLVEGYRSNQLNHGNHGYDRSWTSGYNKDNAGVAPDGYYTAHKWYTPGGIGTVGGSAIDLGTFSYSSGDYVSGSIYVKKGEFRYIMVEFSSYAGWQNRARGVTFDFDTGAIGYVGSGDVISKSAKYVGDGWWRLSWTCLRNLGAGGSSSFLLYNADGWYPDTDWSGANYNATGAVDKGTYWWGPQAEIGLFTTSYIPPTVVFDDRTSKASYTDENGIIRLVEADRGRHNYRYHKGRMIEAGLLLESASTNFLTNPLSSSGAWWYYYGSGGPASLTSLYSSTELSPEGLYNAVDLDASGTAQPYFSSAFNVSASGSWTRNTWSVYVKPYGGTDVYSMWIDDGAGQIGATVQFKISTMEFQVMTGVRGTNSNVYSVDFEKHANGWYRIAMTIDGANMPTSAQLRVYSSDTNFGVDSDGYGTANGSGIDANRGSYFWGAMFEKDVHHATSYILNESGTSGTTRNADIKGTDNGYRYADRLQINDLKNQSWYDSESDVGTLYVEVKTLFGTGTTQETIFVSLHDNTDSTNEIRLYHRGSTSSINFIQSGGGDTILNSSVHGGNSFHKIAAAFGPDDYAMSIDGATVLTDTTNVPAFNDRITSFGIGSSYGWETNSGWLNGHIKKIAYYPTRLTNAELEALSENN